MEYMSKGHMLADVVAIIGRFYFFVHCACYTAQKNEVFH